MVLKVGKSKATQEEQAAKEAVASALQQAGPVVFALVFTTAGYDQTRLAAALRFELGDIPWAGGSSAAVLAGSDVLFQGLVVGVISGEDVRVGVGISGRLSEGGAVAGRRAAEEALRCLPEQAPHRILIVLHDGVSGNSVEVIRGAVEQAGASVTWTGGGTGDNLREINSVQFAGGMAWKDRVVIIALDSASRWGTGIEHGWRPHGPPVMVTRSHGNRLLELDYQPAFDVYRHSLGGQSQSLTLQGFAEVSAMHPLGIAQIFDWHLIRDPIGASADGSLQCLGEVPEGCLVRVMEGERAALVLAATQAAKHARGGVGAQKVGGAIVFECVSRKLALEECLGPELQNIQEALDDTENIIGCLSLGEVGAKGGGPPQYHNKTTIVAAMST